MEIARSLNTARRHYTIEERQTLALEMRDHGYAYQAIAEALGVGKATVYRDVMGVLRVRAEEIVPHETIPTVNHDEIVPHETIEPPTHEEIVPPETISAVESGTSSASETGAAQRWGHLPCPAAKWNQAHDIGG